MHFKRVVSDRPLKHLHLLLHLAVDLFGLLAFLAVLALLLASIHVLLLLNLGNQLLAAGSTRLLSNQLLFVVGGRCEVASERTL